MNIPEESKLQAITEALAEILRIQDWDITVKAASSAELVSNGGDWDDEGNVFVDFRHRCADICINENAEDWYKTLLHELFHVQDADYDHYLTEKFDISNDSACVNIGEQRINQLAKIFEKIYPLSRLEKEVLAMAKKKVKKPC